MDHIHLFGLSVFLSLAVLAGCASPQHDRVMPAEQSFMLPFDSSLCGDSKVGVDYGLVDIREQPNGPVLLRVYSGMWPAFGSVCAMPNVRRASKRERGFTTSELASSSGGTFCREVLFKQPNTQWVLWVSYASLPPDRAARADALIENINLEKPESAEVRIPDCAGPAV